MEQTGSTWEVPQCGAFSRADGSVFWQVWAPHAERVELVLISGQQRHVYEMTRHEHGYFRCTRANIAEGQRYAYRLNGGPERPDPASRWQPDGVHQASAVLQPERFE